MYNLSRNSRLLARAARKCNDKKRNMLKLSCVSFSSTGSGSTVDDIKQTEGKAFSTNAQTASTTSSIDSTSWVDSQKDPLLSAITDSQMQTNIQTIPWFQANMPETYFRQIPEDMRTQHLIAVSAIRQLGALSIHALVTHARTCIE